MDKAKASSIFETEQHKSVVYQYHELDDIPEDERDIWWHIDRNECIDAAKDHTTNKYVADKVHASLENSLRVGDTTGDYSTAADRSANGKRSFDDRNDFGASSGTSSKRRG